jgi:Zn finger protein HypA/HybF involved in hydrogenase expression
MTPDDLTIDELLEIASKTKRLEPKVAQAEVLWNYYKSTMECLQCGRIYHGQRFHPNIGCPEYGFVAWCPKCLDSNIFWSHQQFEVENIDESKLKNCSKFEH